MILGELTASQKQEERRTDRILKYHDMGLNNADIAKLVDCSKENVRQILGRLNKYSNNCWTKNREQYEESY